MRLTLYVLHQGLQYALFRSIRAVAPSPPLFVWQSGAAAGIIHYLFPPRLGGASTDFLTDFTPEERKTGRPFKVTGHVINSPGLPPMYDWELHPADIPHIGTAHINEPVHLYMKSVPFPIILLLDSLTHGALLFPQRYERVRWAHLSLCAGIRW